MENLQGKSSHFQVLMQFITIAREHTSQISIDPCCQSWLAGYGIASSPYFKEQWFYVWKM